MGAKTYKPNHESVLDVEGGTISARDLKAAREVAEDTMMDRAIDRLVDQIMDEARDEDASLTRAARDRDRATPRDVSRVESDRLRGELPIEGDFRRALSGRQRKLRCAIKNRVMAAAPASQHRAIRDLLTGEDSSEWQRVNAELHAASGSAQKLDGKDRAKVQRLDRAVQAYERLNDRTHKVYVAVELPDNVGRIFSKEDLPSNLRPGSTVVFDQFTIAHHNLHEASNHDSPWHLMFELVTSRGLYLGRSDSVEDTTHVLPRGLNLQVVAAQPATYATRSGGFDERLILQLKEI